MKKILLFLVISFLFSFNLHAAEVKKCKDLDGYKKIGKGTAEVMKCLQEGPDGKKRIKLNTQSTLTDWITGKKKITESMPNPVGAIKGIISAPKKIIDRTKEETGLIKKDANNIKIKK
jgi:hypothetical protein